MPKIGEQCGRFLGPNPLGIKSTDPTAPPDWDRNDTGFEEDDPNVRRRAALERAAASLGGRRAAGGAASGGSGGAERGGSGAGDGGSRPSVRLPDLGAILPGGVGGAPDTPQPPAVRDLPNVGAARDDTESQQQLMEFLFGS